MEENKKQILRQMEEIEDMLFNIAIKTDSINDYNLWSEAVDLLKKIKRV